MPRTIGNGQPEFEKLKNPRYYRCYWAPELSVLQDSGFCLENFEWNKCDIWSIGCVFAEMLRFGEPLFRAKSTKSFFNEILKISECIPKNIDLLSTEGMPQITNLNDLGNISLEKYIIYKPDDLESKDIAPIIERQSAIQNKTANCIDFLSHMLKFDPSERFTAERLLHHPFFDNIERSPAIESICSISKELSDLNIIKFVEQCGGI